MSEKPLPVADVSVDLLRRYNVPGPRYTSYPTAPVWREGFGPEEYESVLAESREKERPAPLSLYLHLPFCEHLCYFCACTVVISGNHSVEESYLATIEREIAWVSARAGSDRPVIQLHWGGGTPTYFSPERAGRLAGRLREAFRFAPDAEVSVEVDPRVTSREHLAVLREMGFNRVSMGVQDFDPTVQKAVNRIQSAEQTADLVAAARELGYGGINMDLIFGLPHQTPESFARTIDRVLAIGPDRLAVYSYANVPWMKKHQKLLEPKLPSEREKFEIFRTALSQFTEAGYEYIGMDHFARPDDELSLARRNRTLHRNFQGYTTKAGTDLLGLGMSAIGAIGDAFVQNRRDLPGYRSAVESSGSAAFRGFRLSFDDRLRREIIASMLCHGVVEIPEIEAKYRIRFGEYFADALDRLAACAVDGLVQISATELTATPLGRVFLRNLAMPFDAYLPAQLEKPVFSRTL
ncbi:MAG TPA: oxygen-independent coproporphyrinogen III oxidase [Thermoanaerobaculia bacterium]|nr:oxygen-independent coproporphyrinogen III oxidase [Thermoanaerobaculia bacterium]